MSAIRAMRNLENKFLEKIRTKTTWGKNEIENEFKIAAIYALEIEVQESNKKIDQLNKEL